MVSMSGWRSRPHVRGYSLAGAAAVVSLVFVQVGTEAMVAANVCTLAVAVAVLLWVRRERALLRRGWVPLLVSWGVPLAFGGVALVLGASDGSVTSRETLADLAAVVSVPFTLACLLLVPLTTQRTGHRSRAMADGCLAGSSLWFLLAALHIRETGSAAALVVVAYPVAAVLLVATALTMLARCALPVRPFVARLTAGQVLLAASGLWVSWTAAGPASRGPALLFEGGLLLMVSAAAALRAPGQGSRRGERPWGHPTRLWPWLVGAAPFLPLAGSMVVTARMVVDGADIGRTQVLPALLVAATLVSRQYVGARDKQRLIARLVGRESGLQAALRRDDLTGLANRLGLMESLQRALADREPGHLTFALLDLNDFKLINDIHGHAVGDGLLKQLACRLGEVTRTRHDVVARLGGDEFAVLAHSEQPNAALTLGDRLLCALEAPAEVAGRSFVVTASVGVVVGQSHDTPSRILAYADAAMYLAKEHGGTVSRAHLLAGGDRSEVSRRLQIREAIAAPDVAQFHVVYQPVVDLATGAIRGLETLLRWTHPALGPVPPDVFIPLAEHARTINRLGEHVLDRAIGDLARLQALRPERLCMGINVSPQQMTDPDFADRVLTRITAHHLQPGQVCLEITEQAFEADLDAIAATVTSLVRGGVEFAVDDFGTGYASLQYLQRLPLDVLKIDRAFVGELASDRGRRLVAALIAMGTSLGLQLIAEGIETVDQLRLLQEDNCELGQGYLFSPAAPFAEIERLIAAGHVYPLGNGDAAPLAIPTAPPRDAVA